MPTIGLGISAGLHGQRAIRRYAVSLSRELARLAPESELRLFAWRFRTVPEGFPRPSERVHYCPARVPGRFLNPLWDRGWPPPVETFTGTLDLFHSTDNEIPTVRRARRVFTLHGLAPYMRADLLPADEVRAGRAVIDRAAARCDAFLAVSEDTRRWFEKVFPHTAGRVFVTPLGLDPGFSPSPDERDGQVLRSLGVRPPYLLFVGAVSQLKNVSCLLRAHRIMNRKDLQVVLAGGVTGADPELRTLLRGSLPTGQVVLTGWMDPDGEPLRALYRGATAYVHPSLVEGWTSPPLEAMASGTPVVASRASSIPETVGDAARLFDPLEPEELAEVLSAVLDQEDLRQNLIRQGLERAARFTWERNARLTLDAYREVLK